MQQIGLDATINNVPDFTAGINTMNKAVDGFAKESGQSAKAATTSIDTAGKAIEATVADVAAAAAKAAGLTQDAAGRWRNATGRFASDAELAAAGIEKIGPAARGAGDAARGAGHDFSAFGEIVTGALRKVGELAVESLLKAGQAVAGFVNDSIGLAGDFEAGMLEFQAVAGKDVDASGLEEFRDLFIDIGKRLPVSTSEVEQAAIEMVKGGIDPAIVAAGGLEQNIQFAAAAMGGDLVAAANVSSKILGGWADANATASDKAAFLTHATDQLTKAANASSVDVHELSLGIFNAQGIAKTAGVSFDDLTTTLAALSPRFASSSEAGNSLKNVIARLQPTTDPAIMAMRSLGLLTEDGANKFYDAQGSFVGFEQASQLLQDSLKGLTDQQKQAVLQTIFGNDAMNAAAGLADLGAAGYRNMADALDTANGVAENAALKQQGFNTALENAKGSVEALQITVGSALLPVLTDLLNNVVAPAVNTFTDMADAVFGNEEAFARLSPSAQAVVSIIGTLVDDVQNIIGAFEDAGAGSSEFAEAIGGLASDLGLPGELIQDLVRGVQDTVAWFDKGSDASDDLGSAVDGLSGIWTKAIGVVENMVAGYQDIIQSVLPIVTAFVEEHGDEISAFFKTAYDQIIRIVNLALDLYDAIVPPILHAIADFIQEHGDDIQTIFSGAWDVITGVIGAALQLIEGTIRLAIDLINGDWAQFGTDLQTMSAGFVENLVKIITGFLDIIAGFFGTSLEGIVDLWQNNWDMLVDIATQTDWAQVGRDVVDGIISGLSSAWGSLVGWITDKVSGLVDKALEAVGAGSPAKEWMPVGAFSVQGIMQGFSDMWPGLTSLVSTLGDDLVQQAADIATNVQESIADAFGATASIDRQIAANLDKFKDILPEYEQFTQGALKQAQKEAEAFLDPAEGAKFFKMRSDQILEYAKLQTKLSDQQQAIQDAIADKVAQSAKTDELRVKLAADLTNEQRKALQDQLKITTDVNAQKAIQAQLDADLTDSQRESVENQITVAQTAQVAADAARDAAIATIDRLNQQMILINRAQAAALSEFQTRSAARANPIDDIITQLQQLFGGEGVPGVLENDVIRQLSALLGQLQSPVANPYANPGTSMTSNYRTTNLNMPIYTNQSPSVMSDSMAIAGAALL